MLADQAFASAATECLCDITDLCRKLDGMLLMMKKKIYISVMFQYYRFNA